MKLFFPLVLAILLLTGSGLAQAPPPPPPMAPDYLPKNWKEYSFTEDNLRFRFPVEPKRVESTSGTAKHPSSTYSRESFIYFLLNVVTFPHSLEQDGDEGRGLMDSGEKGMLDRIKNLEPKILERKDSTLDGYPARFVKLETNNGLLIRVKFFSVANRLYIAQAIVKKGDRHGINWENDFEIPAMGFLDSIHLIKGK